MRPPTVKPPRAPLHPSFFPMHPPFSFYQPQKLCKELRFQKHYFLSKFLLLLLWRVPFLVSASSTESPSAPGPGIPPKLDNGILLSSLALCSFQSQTCPFILASLSVLGYKMSLEWLQPHRTGFTPGILVPHWCGW